MGKHRSLASPVALDRLTDEGLVEVDREETVDGRLRRYYRLTDPGIAALAAEAEQMRRDARMVTQRLSAARPAGAPRSRRSRLCSVG